MGFRVKGNGSVEPFRRVAQYYFYVVVAKNGLVEPFFTGRFLAMFALHFTDRLLRSVQNKVPNVPEITAQKPARDVGGLTLLAKCGEAGAGVPFVSKCC